MATRKFELPGIQDLTKEQERVRALPKCGQHLIVGGPGTGKSVLALIRARRHAQDQDHYRFLVHNHLLHRASQQLFGEGLMGKTWETWFRAFFSDTLNQDLPLLPPQRKMNYRSIDWEAVQEIARSLPAPENLAKSFLVIDEGQDMPPEFYHVLGDLGFENFFVACDQNQQITEQNSSRQDIEDCLAIDNSDVIELVHNHRNNYPVARLAREFYTGDPASPPPELPQSSSRAGVPRLYVYESSREGLRTVAERILRQFDLQPGRLIGVIAPKNEVRERYFDSLQEAKADMRWDNESPTIKTFHGSYRPDLRFDQGGIMVINVQACKGLEFDDVVLADIDQHKFWSNDMDAIRKRFYVMVARARENVFMFMRQGSFSRVEEILPNDETILRREEEKKPDSFMEEDGDIPF